MPGLCRKSLTPRLHCPSSERVCSAWPAPTCCERSPNQEFFLPARSSPSAPFTPWPGSWRRPELPDERKLATTVYTLTAVSILSPLLWESTLRFNLVTAREASLILVAFTLIGLVVSWRKNLVIVATLSTLAGLSTAAGLLVATHDVLPFIFVFLAVAAAVEACACLNHWLGVRWVAAIMANLSIVLATWLVTNPLGLPDVYAPISAGSLFAAQMALLAIYLSSVMVRTLLRHLTITTFETGQCALAFLIGLGGAMRLSGADSHIIPAIGGFALLCGAACYALSFVVLERHGSHGRNFYTYSTFGILLLLVGGRIVLRDGAEVILWSVLAVVCIGAGGLWGRMTLEVHGGIYLALALVLIGRAAAVRAGFWWEPTSGPVPPRWPSGAAARRPAHAICWRYARLPAAMEVGTFTRFRVSAAHRFWSAWWWVSAPGTPDGPLSWVGRRRCRRSLLRYDAYRYADPRRFAAGVGRLPPQVHPPRATRLSPHASRGISPCSRRPAPRRQGGAVPFAVALWRRAHGDPPPPPAEGWQSSFRLSPQERRGLKLFHFSGLGPQRRAGAMSFQDQRGE